MHALTRNSFRKTLILSFIVCLSFLLMAAANAENSTDNNLTANDDVVIVNDEPLKSGSFMELSQKINETPENQELVLDRDYEYDEGSNHGIVVSKPIIIDGDGHTLDAKKSSRIFNVTADNVVLKNINFINGNSLGFYYTFYGGGAIYWSGNNGSIQNCIFTANTATGLEVDPYAEPEIVHHDDDGSSWVEYKERPVGASTNQGGAITWMGADGEISYCSFKNNHVDYPNDGGSIYWAGENGKITYCEFLDNNAFCGSAVYWSGVNGTIIASYFLNDGICDNGIFWTGENGTIRNSILLKQGNSDVIAPYSENVDANLNFWGDTIENPNEVNKFPGVKNWVLISIESSDEFVFEGDEFQVKYEMQKLVFDSTNKTYRYYGVTNNSGNVKFTAEKTGFIKAFFKNNTIQIEYLENNYTDDFIELAQKIRNTPENGTLVLDKNYSYIAGSNKGILISKPIIIDGAGHTLDGKWLSRMFNVTADNVVLKNINFVKGNAFGQYYNRNVGGGAIYWSGDNGVLENCNFILNHGLGIENDPFDKGEELIYCGNGLVMTLISTRPMGAATNKGGAIVWNGDNGLVSNCVFKNNTQGYPNAGGAIFWKGDNGRIIDSEFYDNCAWLGSAIYWAGNDGVVEYSRFNHSDIFYHEIYWSGVKGTIRYSILLSRNTDGVVQGHGSLNADYNYWGDARDNVARYSKLDNTMYWYVLDYDKIDITVANLINGAFSLVEKPGRIIVPAIFKASILSNDSTQYFQKINKITVRVFDVDGKAANNQYVTFKINKNVYNVKSDKNGYATLNIKQKPGNYNVIVNFKDITVKNKIQIKNTLITKNLSKKVRKSANFKVKVLNVKGKAYKNQMVKVKFKGKTYKLKTNSKGIATFKIPKNLKKGKYTIKTTYNGLTNSNKIIVKK